MASMRRNAFIVLLLCVAEALFAQQEIIMPPFLKAGDTIAVISPSSTPDSLTVAKGCDAIKAWGFVAIVGTHALDNYHNFAEALQLALCFYDANKCGDEVADDGIFHRMVVIFRRSVHFHQCDFEFFFPILVT